MLKSVGFLLDIKKKSRVQVRVYMNNGIVDTSRVIFFFKIKVSSWIYDNAMVLGQEKLKALFLLQHIAVILC